MQPNMQQIIEMLNRLFSGQGGMGQPQAPTMGQPQMNRPQMGQPQMNRPEVGQQMGRPPMAVPPAFQGPPTVAPGNSGHAPPFLAGGPGSPMGQQMGNRTGQLMDALRSRR